MDEKHRKFLYEFAVWIHRAIVVYNDSHEKNEIVLHRQIQDEGKGSHKKKSNTLLDVILSLIRFNKENQQFFTFILKNLHRLQQDKLGQDHCPDYGHCSGQ